MRWPWFDRSEENLLVNSIKSKKRKFKPFKDMNHAEKQERVTYLWG